MNEQTRKIVVGIGRTLLKAIRLVAYVLLLLLGRVLLPVTSLATGLGTIVFLFCLLVRPDMATPKWAGLGLAVAAVLVSAFYGAALRLVAPHGVVIVSDV
jgi:hypothetical protein